MKIKRLVLRVAYGYGPEDSQDNSTDVDLENFFTKLTEETDLLEDEEQESSDEGDEGIGGENGGADDSAGNESVEKDPADKKPEESLPTEQPTVTDKPVEDKPAPVETPAEESAKPLTEEEQLAQLNQVRGALEQQYALTDEDAEAVLTDPKGTLPRLMANVHLQMMAQFAQMMQVAVPQIVEATTKQSQTKQSINDQFAKRRPELASDTSARDTVITAIRTVKSANPTAPLDQVIEKVGPVAYALLGKQMPVPAPANQPPKQTAKPKARPHTPAKAVTSPPKTQSTDSLVAFIDTLLDSKD